MYLVLGLLLIMSKPLFASQEGELTKAYLSDAKISASTGDLYRSYKLYTYLYKNHKKYFAKEAVEEYLSITSKIASAKRFQNTCDVLGKKQNIRNRVYYQCSKILYELGENKQAAAYLKKVEKEDKFSYLKPLLSASIRIVSEDYYGCLKELEANSLSLYEENNLQDLFYLTRARCLNGSGDYSKAITNYQNINSSSNYYFDALLELSWSQFKVKNIEGVKGTTEAIFATYNPAMQSVNKDGANAQQYFQSKYIMAFLDLVLFTSKQSAEFKEINESLKKYREEYFLQKKDLVTFYKEIKMQDSLSSLKNNSNKYKKFIYQIGQWLSFEEMKELDDTIVNLIALNKEIKTAESLGKKYNKYKSSLKLINAHYDSILKTKISFAYDKAYRKINGFVLKNKIGSVDFNNLEKTSGIKSLDQATTKYKEKQNNLSKKLGGFQ